MTTIHIHYLSLDHIISFHYAYSLHLSYFLSLFSSIISKNRDFSLFTPSSSSKLAHRYFLFIFISIPFSILFLFQYTSQTPFPSYDWTMPSIFPWKYTKISLDASATLNILPPRQKSLSPPFYKSFSRHFPESAINAYTCTLLHDTKRNSTFFHFIQFSVPNSFLHPYQTRCLFPATSPRDISISSRPSVTPRPSKYVSLLSPLRASLIPLP